MKDEYSEEKLGRFWIGTIVRHITNAKFNFFILILWNHKMPLTIPTLVRCLHTLQSRISSMWWKIVSHLRQIYGPRLQFSPHMFHFPNEQISPSSTEKYKGFLTFFKDFFTEKQFIDFKLKNCHSPTPPQPQPNPNTTKSWVRHGNH